MSMTLEQLQAGLSNPRLVTTFVTRGRIEKVSTGIRDKKTGLVKTVDVVKPAPLALMASAMLTDLNLYTLARVLKSEGWSGPVSQKAKAIACIGQAVVNHARTVFGDAPDAITRVVTASRFARANGLYGEQSGRYCASTSDPRPWHVEMARSILDGTIPNLVGEAEYFLDPWGPGAKQRGKLLEPFETVLRRWHEVYRWARVAVQGLSEANIMFFRPESDPEIRTASLSRSVDAWRAAFKGGKREPESEGHSVGAADAPGKRQFSMNAVDHAFMLVTQIDLAAREFGLTSVNRPGTTKRFYPRMSRTYYEALIAYWIPELESVAPQADQIPDSALRDQWRRNVSDLLATLPGLATRAITAGKMMPDADAVDLWRRLETVVLGMDAIKQTPTVFAIALESVVEALKELPKRGEDIYAFIKKAAIFTGAAVVGIVVVDKVASK